MKNRRKAVQPFEIKKRKIDIFRNYEAYGFEKNQRKFENFSTLISKKSIFWFSLLFVIVIYILFVQQTGSFATMRRLTKELQEQRKLATDQEASRLTDVKADFEKKWQVWMEEQKQILSQTEQRLTERQNKILEAFKGAEDQIAAANKELNTSISGTLDTMDDKITKILIANKNPDQQ